MVVYFGVHKQEASPCIDDRRVERKCMWVCMLESHLLFGLVLV